MGTSNPGIHYRYPPSLAGGLPWVGLSIYEVPLLKQVTYGYEGERTQGENPGSEIEGTVE